ncbi:hypothetical protein E3P89_00975 [Wallemia ichthyophaga]|uniref:Hydantoin racemase n=1 Tax=Wallemia ichthyophaga TaxID=245174 RepID=A0A4V4M0F2_WALIC|nr:hypothetical protein E3P90_01270 [Wallemia ichthyophaga]TIB16223.1 hypothetical protein E3P93_01021 [Wallemia ichthyophaga]TIB24416.1 hypothetical protein E3P89_00975 [Wallemia ichthyophaga]TIB26200.1 hypothetical protein E3P88_01139 [Wallemia ichthyophaga]
MWIVSIESILDILSILNALNTLTTQMPSSILLLNPNSSEQVTEGLRSLVGNCSDDECSITTQSAQPEAPRSIYDTASGVKSAMECYKRNYTQYDGVIVGCYSNHPLIPMLRERYKYKQIIGVLEASITAALLSPARKFGFVTTSPHWIDEFGRAVGETLGIGANASDRYVGTTCSDFDVVELRTAKESTVNAKLIHCAQDLVQRGANTVVLACAGMAGKNVIDGVQVAVDQMKMLVKML